MKAKTDKKRLELLFKGLKEFSCEGIFDMGLIISKSVPKKSELDQFFPKGIQHEVISVGKESFPDDVIAEILDAFQDKKWVVISLEDGVLPGRLYNQLRLLATLNRIQIMNLTGKNEANVRQPKESRVVLVSSKENLEKIENPTFMNLFGMVADIS